LAARSKALFDPRDGFTLIELSIVLVIIGLVVGGVLVGRDLIKAAEVRATVSQIEKLRTAMNTFYGKYGYLPGDIPNPYASQFGFAARGSLGGQGDGNGVIIGDANNDGPVAHVQCAGETPMVWVDLSTAKLIDGNFNSASETASNPTAVTGAGFDMWFPQAKLGGGNYIIVEPGDGSIGQPVNVNFFDLVAPTLLPAGCSGDLMSYSGVTAAQAHGIDLKIDDGLPQEGGVLAGGMSNGSSHFWAAGGSASGADPGTAAPASSITCFDNGGTASAPMRYSLATNGGAGINCALSFKFLAGD